MTIIITIRKFITCTESSIKHESEAGRSMLIVNELGYEVRLD